MAIVADSAGGVKLRRRVQVLVSQAYRPGAPRSIDPMAEQAFADRAASSDCPVCQTHGLEYHGFHRDQEFRALIACDVCGYSEEMPS